MSLVANAVTNAFSMAISNPQGQQFLAMQRSMQVKLFDDIAATLQGIQRADDVMISSIAEQIGHWHDLSAAQYRNWIKDYPSGVLFPITLVTPKKPDSSSSPMRVVIMVPVRTNSKWLSIPRQLATILAEDLWKDQADEALGKNAAIFIGANCDEYGQWQYSPVAAWGLATASEPNVLCRPLPILPDGVQIVAKQHGWSLNDAMDAIVRDQVLDDIACILASLNQTKK
ncbi:MAG: hypothetical protein ACM34A_01725 [Bacillota bacterium]